MKPSMDRLAYGLQIGRTVDVQERRKAVRRAVDTQVRVSNSAEERCDARISDLSLHGCNVKCEAVWLRIGAFISIELGEDRPVEGIVRWVRDDSCGVEFLHPLSHDLEDWQTLIGQSEGW